MSKKSQKLLFGAAAIGFAAAIVAAYHKKSKSVQDDLYGEEDYEDDFQNETEEEDTFSKEDLEDAQVTTEKRHYVPINLDETTTPEKETATVTEEIQDETKESTSEEKTDTNKVQ